jgi:hypothetical protein
MRARSGSAWAGWATVAVARRLSLLLGGWTWCWRRQALRLAEREQQSQPGSRVRMQGRTRGGPLLCGDAGAGARRPYAERRCRGWWLLVWGGPPTAGMLLMRARMLGRRPRSSGCSFGHGQAGHSPLRKLQRWSFDPDQRKWLQILRIKT